MCMQVNSLFKCGHRAFDKFDNCPEFVHIFSSFLLAPCQPHPPTCITSLPLSRPSHVCETISLGVHRLTRAAGKVMLRGRRKAQGRRR